MRLLYVSRSAAGHDHRFIDGWRSVGFDVVSVVAGDHADQSRIIADAVSKASPDVVHAGPITDVAWEAARVWDGPLIAMSWGFDLMDEIDRDAVHLARAKSVVARANLFVVDNDGPRRRALELGVDPAKIVQFPWGLEAHWFRSDHRPPLSTPATTFFTSRRHEAIYRVADVIDAFAEAAVNNESTVLRVAGAGSLTSELKSRAAATPARERITFLGELDGSQLAVEYAGADAYVSASSVDGTSISLLEAMASGVPVIVSDIEGNRQWVSTSTGVRFDVGDVAALTRVFDEFAQRDDTGIAEIRARANAAADKVAREADWQSTVESLPAIARAAIAEWKKS